ncbi:hypothetical protein [Lacinutrix sp.]|uniref:hypothetical protein n=1 Tax=Lacinutrix sp. TaxID=1937692 RepID=UPI0025C3948C|nr:hypothetical protein [Lacinutrix sp.]
MISTNILLIAAIALFVIIYTPLFLQRIKLSKERKTLDAQDKKIREMNNKQNGDKKYKDFTDGHMYQ